MPFNDALREQRLARGLSEGEAADIFQLPLRGYRDREAGMGNVSFPERCGLLVGLGLTWDEAVAAINKNPNVSEPLADIALNTERLHRLKEDPFVRETAKAFVFVSRQHNQVTLKILKRKLTRPDDILHSKMGISCQGKTWVTQEHINQFIRLASQHIGFQLNPLESPEGESEVAAQS